MLFRSKRRIFYVGAGLFLLLGAAKTADDFFEISKNLEIFNAAYREANAHYVDELKPGDMMKKGIDAMLNTLDPYTNFFTEAQAEEALMDREGEYSGVGCQVEIRAQYPVITEVFGNTPFAAADIRPGDIIRRINGRDVKGRSREEIGSLLRGGAGTSLSLSLDRQGATLEKSITRREIRLKNVPYYGMIDASTGYIKLDQFGENCATEVRNALLELKRNAGIEALVLDLRGNGGGLLQEAVDIVNLFVPREQLVVSTKGRAGGLNREFRTANPPVDLNIRIAVLLNHRSASASEVVSGTLQDLDRGIVVGRNSYGKGLVQNTFPLPYRTQLKVTTARYYTPSGRCIQLLDYSKRNPDGSAGSIADSLRNAFQTKNGRTVYDGGGVRPDAVVEDPWNKGIYRLLNERQLVFQFANRWRNAHDSPPSPAAFTLPDDAWNRFVEEAVFDLEVHHRERMLKQSRSLTDDAVLDERLLPDTKEASRRAFSEKLNTERKGIQYRLELEIARRFFYDRAEYEKGLRQDPDVLKASSLLGDKPSYEKLLRP